MAGIFFLELMETHVTLLIASISNMFHQPILHQPSVTDKPETIKLERHHAKLRRTCTICQAMALSQRPTIAAG